MPSGYENDRSIAAPKPDRLSIVIVVGAMLLVAASAYLVIYQRGE